MGVARRPRNPGPRSPDDAVRGDPSALGRHAKRRADRRPKLAEELAQLVASRIPFDEFSPRGCEESGYLLHPTSAGIVFRMQPDRIGTCSNQVEIPFSDLLPHLTPEASAFAAGILGRDE